MKEILLLAIILTFTTLISAESAEISQKPTASEQCIPDKITFDLNSIDKEGLVGSSDGKVSVAYDKVSVSYEFCIPYEDQYLKEIQGIDPDMDCYHGSGGRIGCGRVKDEYLCIGDTGHKDYKAILCKLSTLSYIKRIDQTFWE